MKTRKINFYLSCIISGILCSCTSPHPSVAELRASKRAKDSIALFQQERTLAYTDSLLRVTLPQIDPLLKTFVYEKNDRYQDHGCYVHRLLRTTAHIQHNYLQAQVCDDRQLVLKSHYYGLSALAHTTISLSADDNTNHWSGSLHSFQNEGHYEILTLSHDDAMEALRFIDAFAALRIRVTLSGKRQYNYYLPDAEKQALVQTLQLVVLMNDIHQLETQLRQTSIQVEKYKKRLEK